MNAWGKRNLIYVNGIICVCSPMGSTFPFISLQEGLILKCSSLHGISLVHFISLFTNILLLPFGLQETLGSFIYKKVFMGGNCYKYCLFSSP